MKTTRNLQGARKNTGNDEETQESRDVDDSEATTNSW